MDPSENIAVADQEAEENHIGLRDQDQRAEREGMTNFPQRTRWTREHIFILRSVATMFAVIVISVNFRRSLVHGAG